MSSAKVIYVHGVWMPGEEMLFVQRHLKQRHSLSGHLFDYPSVKGTLDENAKLLGEFVTGLDADAFSRYPIGPSLSERCSGFWASP